MSQLLQAVDQLTARIVSADCIGQALDVAGGETSPAWVTVYRDQIDAISRAAETLETMIRKAEHVHA
jgi:hypothetical protein